MPDTVRQHIMSESRANVSDHMLRRWRNNLNAPLDPFPILGGS